MTHRRQPDANLTRPPVGPKEAIMARTKLQDPAVIATQVAAGEDVQVPTFTHEVSGIAFEAPVVLKCAQSGRVNPVAKIEGGVYVKDNTLVGNDKTSKHGLYRIDKAADKDNQSAWRAKRAEALEAAKENGVVDEDLNVIADNGSEVEEAPAPKARPRKRSTKVQAA
jgi:hypothetical protein